MVGTQTTRNSIAEIFLASRLRGSDDKGWGRSGSTSTGKFTHNSSESKNPCHGPPASTSYLQWGSKSRSGAPISPPSQSNFGRHLWTLRTIIESIWLRHRPSAVVIPAEAGTQASPDGRFGRTGNDLTQFANIEHSLCRCGHQTLIARAVAERAGQSNTRGLRVVEVQGGSPADAAGVRRGDILVALDGEPITGVDDIARLLDDERIGVSATIHLLRSAAPLAVSIVPVER